MMLLAASPISVKLLTLVLPCPSYRLSFRDNLIAKALMQIKGSQNISLEPGQYLNRSLNSGQAKQCRLAIDFVDKNIQIAIVGILAVEN